MRERILCAMVSGVMLALSVVDTAYAVQQYQLISKEEDERLQRKMQQELEKLEQIEALGKEGKKKQKALLRHQEMLQWLQKQPNKETDENLSLKQEKTHLELKFELEGLNDGEKARLNQVLDRIDRGEWLEKYSNIQRQWYFSQERKDGMNIYKISGEKLVELFEDSSLRKGLDPDEQKLFDALIFIHAKAHNIQKSLDGDERNPGIDIPHYLAPKYAKFLYKESIRRLFNIEDLEEGTPQMVLFEKALFEMAGNPHGAKRLISLLLLKLNPEYAKLHFGFSHKFNSAIRIIDPPSDDPHGNGISYNPNALFLNLTRVEKSFESDLSDQEYVAGTLMHELTHFYHYILFGSMPKKIAILDDTLHGDIIDAIRNNLYPSLNADLRKQFYDMVMSYMLDFGSKAYAKLLEDLNALWNVIKNPGVDSHGHPIQLLINAAGYEAHLDAAENKVKGSNSQKELTADIITEFMFSCANYWSNEEEMLTIFGAVVEKDSDGKPVLIIDRDNHNSFLDRARLKAGRFSHAVNPFTRPVAFSSALGRILALLTIAGSVDQYKKYKSLRMFVEDNMNVMVRALIDDGKASGSSLAQSEVFQKKEIQMLPLWKLVAKGQAVPRTAELEKYELPADLPTGDDSMEKILEEYTHELDGSLRTPWGAAPYENPLRIQSAARNQTPHAAGPQMKRRQAKSTTIEELINSHLTIDCVDSVLDRVLAKENLKGLETSICNIEALAGATYSDGNTILHKAILNNCSLKEIIEPLVKCFKLTCVVPAQGWEGCTAAMLEQCFKPTDGLNTQNRDGCTALYLAAERGQKNIVEMLFNNGADINARNYALHTPLWAAMAHESESPGHREVVAFLRMKGATL
ncbi:hypothetical protein FACS189449_02810 [Alphaproteobacteria bacterium]|nr:hypothetical protein FACS189449_02810 [Alphaproteobacteria bacterium]